MRVLFMLHKKVRCVRLYARQRNTTFQPIRRSGNLNSHVPLTQKYYHHRAGPLNDLISNGNDCLQKPLLQISRKVGKAFLERKRF